MITQIDGVFTLDKHIKYTICATSTDKQVEDDNDATRIFLLWDFGITSALT